MKNLKAKKKKKPKTKTKNFKVKSVNKGLFWPTDQDRERRSTKTVTES